MTEPTEPRNELLAHAVDSIMRGMSEAFERVWQRPDAPALVAGFLDDRVAFQIDRGGITIAARTEGDPPSGASAPVGPPDTPKRPPPDVGLYL